MFFVYTTQAVDTDTDGVSIAANALTLNGGTIQDSGGNAATLSLSGQTITNAAVHKVDGSADNLGPSVNGVSFEGTQGRDTYGVGEHFRITVAFTEDIVRADIQPTLALTIGTYTRQANVTGGSGTARALDFAYAVQATDADTDGISIAANALTLNSGTIQDSGGNAATLSLSGYTITNDVNHKVDGSIDRAPTVRRVGINSGLVSGDTYGIGETISVWVDFGEAVTVNGTPQLALTIGAYTYYIDYTSGSGSRYLTFTYTVRSADRDTDGIRIPVRALRLNGGTIRDAGGNNAVLHLSSYWIDNVASYAAAHKVDGRVDNLPQPTVSFM